MTNLDKNFISGIVIEALEKLNNMSHSEASKAWFSSKTKKELLDSGDPEYEGLAATRAYDELLMELEGNPRWMQGSFF